MSRSFISTTLLSLILIASVMGVCTPIARAQSLSGPTTSGCLYGQPGWPNCVTAGTGLPGSTGSPGTTPTAPATGAPSATTPAGVNATTSAIPTPSSGPSSWTDPSAIMAWVMSLFAWLFGAAAAVMEYAAYYTVVTMGSYVNGLSAVGVVFGAMQSLGNIVLIFGFLAIGITTILNVNWYGKGTKMLPMLLVAAALINFSLFMAEAIIDVGNLFATELYAQINGGNIPNPATLFSSGQGIAGAIMQKLDLQEFYNVTSANAAANGPSVGSSAQNAYNSGCLGGWSNLIPGMAASNAANCLTATASNYAGGKLAAAATTWIIGFFGIILFTIAAFVMFSIAFVLVARMVILLVVIIVAPIGFAGLAVPNLSGTAKLWWHTLLQETMTAPVLFLLLYVALKIITDANFLGGLGTNGDPTPYLNYATDPAGFASLLLSFFVAMGFLILVVVASKKMSAFGAGFATQTAGKLSFGLIGVAGRTTIGAGSQYLSKSIRTSRYANTKTGRVLAGTFDRGAKASFDLRATNLIKNIPGGGINAGTPNKGGYRARQEAAIKGHEEYIKSVGQAIDERGTTKEEDAKIAAAEEKRMAVEASRDEAKKNHSAATQEVEDHKAEVARLATINKNNRARGIFDQQNINDLNAAEQNLKTSELNLQTADARKTAAESELTTAKAAEVAAGKEAGDRMSAQKKAVATGYAENISGLPVVGSLPGWALFGPGGNLAAQKIIKNSKKSSDQAMLDSLKKALAKAGEEKSEEAEKPEAKTT
jgi:hypothetical protein